MDVNSFLANDEHITAEYKGKRKAHFYATDRRLIWTRKGNLLDASYNHINTIGMAKVSHRGLLALGIIIFIVGIAVAAVGAADAGIAVLIIGLIVIVISIVLRGSVYTLSLSSGEKILVPKTKSSNVDAFIKSIRDKIR